MTRSVCGFVLVALVASTGCNLGRSGGPGAANTPAPMVGQADGTFNLRQADARLKQGEAKSVTIGIKRATNFNEDVTLQFATLPRGLSVDNERPVILHGDSEARFMLTAANDASIGDFSLVVTGHPTKGPDATNELKITVEQR